MLTPKKTFAEMGFPGRLIAVEGLDGSGKSTQIYLLKRWLQLEGLRVFFSEWNSSELVKAATSKGKKREPAKKVSGRHPLESNIGKGV